MRLTRLQLLLLVDGREVIIAAGCVKKIAFITRDIYCGKHGRAAGWPCKGKRTA
jgi:hypothetical protein